MKIQRILITVAILAMPSLGWADSSSSTQNTQSLQTLQPTQANLQPTDTAGASQSKGDYSLQPAASPSESKSFLAGETTGASPFDTKTGSNSGRLLQLATFALLTLAASFFIRAWTAGRRTN